ncbi:MAG: hypothetical protein ACOZNI_05520 [Myxococcota bacterium]
MDRRVFLCGGAAVLAGVTLPSRLLAAEGLGDDDTIDRLARGVARWVARGVGEGDFSTGHRLFDREWMFGTHQMAALGFGQWALRRPERRDEAVALMDTCLDRMLDDDGRAFDRASWGEDALQSRRGHAAYLGYLGLALGLRAKLGPSRFDGLGFAERIAARVGGEPCGVFETYPGERYPVDVAAGVGALGLFGGHDALVRAWGERLRRDYVVGGVLVQSVRGDGTPLDAPRGSGTFLAAYFLSFADPALSRALYEGGRDALFDTVAGFGAMREYVGDGRGDIDSGPIVAGLGVSATGFAIGPARVHGDDATLRALVATATFFGRPVDSGDARNWATGGPLGDAILFAMMSA